MLDGFEPLDPSYLADGSHLNLYAYRNCFSPFSRVDRVTPRGGDASLWVDRYYGLVYDGWIEQGGAAYGVTERLPAQVLDDRADLGFLRVPFARIPRIWVSSRAQIESLISIVRDHLPECEILFRGQTREYLLPRSEQTRQALYGDRVALEPSLTPSAGRAGIDIETILPVWTGALRWSLDSFATYLKNDQLRERFIGWWNHYQFGQFALAMAQHYGLPSSGLDVTDSLDVALFFALTTLERMDAEPDWRRCRSKADWSHPSVLYVFAAPTKYHQIDFERTVLAELPTTRPHQQSARFLARGWGYNQNDSARWLAVAMYLGRDGDCGTLPSCAALFPNEEQDPVGTGLYALRKLELRLPLLGEYLKHFYWAKA